MNRIIFFVSKDKLTPPPIIAPTDLLLLIVAKEFTADPLQANLAAWQLAGAPGRDAWINN